MYEGYSTFGTVEIVNSQRAFELARVAGAGFFRNPRQPQIEQILDETIIDSGAVTDFTDVTQAPWYDPNLDDLSSRFIGVYGLRMDGIYDSTSTATVTENSGNGGVIGAPRQGTRSVRVRVGIAATGRDALAYGRVWLQEALSLNGCSQDDDCGRADVAFWAEAPADVDEALVLSRFLKFSATVSGPFTVEQAVSRGVFYEELEWTWTSEKPFLFGPERSVDLEIAPALALIQDSPINWIKYPSAELEVAAGGSYVRPVVARNRALQGSLEVDATGWTSSATLVSGSAPAPYLSAAAKSSQTYAFGTSSVKTIMLGNESTSASGVCTFALTSPAVDVSAVPAGRYVQFGIWAAKLLLAGAATAMTALSVSAVWLDAAGATVATTPLAADSRGLGVYSSAKTLIPATAVKAYVKIETTLTWTSGNTDATNSEARLYADALTVAYMGV